MARRGTSKRKSRDQEDFVAGCYDGVVSPSSGAADTDQGDVRSPVSLIECKAMGEEGKEDRPSLNQILTWLSEITYQAWEEGRDPVLCLRIWAENHPLSRHGVLDLAITHVTPAGDRDQAWARELHVV
jgi:hypothetical protein